MVVFSNRRLGAASELLVSPAVAAAMLRTTAEAARPRATAHWEHELVRWLADHASEAGLDLDVGDIAWTPDNFEHQKRFVIAAIECAAVGSEHARALGLWGRMITAHPREWVVVGRRWRWTGNSVTA